MKVKDRFTKICVLSVRTWKQDYDEEFYITIRYLVNESQPKLEEIILLTSLPCFYSFPEYPKSLPLEEFCKLLEPYLTPDWAVEYLACLYCLI